ncbi:MAG: carboxypeptidase-like regulatory domain-containing protein [Cyclobacteriaceae bacterium]
MFRLSLAFFLTFHFAYSQISIKGKVVDQYTKKPIAYANIGIVNTGIGTISNEDGSFSLQVPDVNLKDTLRLSAIGFAKKNLAIQSFFNRDLTIYLEEQITELNEVTVTSKKEKNKFFELGNKKSRGGTLETDTVYAGSATALLIENVNPIQKDLSFPVYLKSARIRIFRNNLPSFKLRVRLYSIDSVTHCPGEDLLKKSIVVESSMKNGWVIFDFSELQFLVTKPFFVAFERILTKKDRELIATGFQEFMRKHPNRLKVDTVIFEGKKQVRNRLGLSGIDLPGTFIGIAGNEAAKKIYKCYTRKSSFDKWEKVRGVLAATVTVSNQPPKKL